MSYTWRLINVAIIVPRWIRFGINSCVAESVFGGCRRSRPPELKNPHKLLQRQREGEWKEREPRLSAAQRSRAAVVSYVRAVTEHDLRIENRAASEKLLVVRTLVNMRLTQCSRATCKLRSEPHFQSTCVIVSRSFPARARARAVSRFAICLPFLFRNLSRARSARSPVIGTLIVW